MNLRTFLSAFGPTSVHGRGVEMPHCARIGDDGDRLRKLNVDFMFLGSRGTAGETIPVLVIREEKTRMTLSSAVPSKTTGEFVARVLAFLSEIGCLYGDVIVKSDQEPALISLAEDVGRRRGAVGGGRWICEKSPVGSSASNGVAERAIQSVQQQVRVLKLALEDKWNMKIPHTHSVVPYSAILLNRFEVGHDGKTAYERLKGKKAKVLGIAFGEMVNGCRSILKDGSRQGHSVACRARMKDLLRDSDKFEKSQQRVNEFLEKAIIESEHETKRRKL